MNPDQQDQIRLLHDTPDQAVLAVTGGGARAIGQLLSVGGASRTVLSAYVPYSVEALQDFLRDWRSQHACDDATARRMAVEAFDIAHDLAPPGAAVHGVACTASLASDRPKRGPHRVHVAAQSKNRTAVYSVTLAKDARTRDQEERVACAMVLDALAEAAGLAGGLTEPLLQPGEALQSTQQTAPPDWPELGSDVAWRAGMPQRNAQPTPPPKVVMPGAFNPLHEGHRRMAATAQAITGHPVTLELSIENVDKAPLDYVEVAQRVARMGNLSYLVTRAPTFVAKSALFPGSTFVVGVDTLIRIADEDYYEGSEAQRDAAIQEIADAGCRLLVFGRAFDNEFITLESLGLPPILQTICDGVSEEQFRLDVSSTELRGGEEA